MPIKGKSNLYFFPLSQFKFSQGKNFLFQVNNWRYSPILASLQLKGLSGGLPLWRAANVEAFHLLLQSREVVMTFRLGWLTDSHQGQCGWKLSLISPFDRRSKECFPAPRRECTPGTPEGISRSRIGPICLHICKRWSGAICLLAAT